MVYPKILRVPAGTMMAAFVGRHFWASPQAGIQSRSGSCLRFGESWRPCRQLLQRWKASSNIEGFAMTFNRNLYAWTRKLSGVWRVRYEVGAECAAWRIRSHIYLHLEILHLSERTKSWRVGSALPTLPLELYHCGVNMLSG